MILPLLFVWAQYVPNLNANAVKLLKLPVLPVPLFQHSSRLFTFRLHFFLHPSIYLPEIPIILSLSVSLSPSDDPLCINPISQYLPQTNSITQAFLPTTYQFVKQNTLAPKTPISPSGHS